MSLATYHATCESIWSYTKSQRLRIKLRNNTQTRIISSAPELDNGHWLISLAFGVGMEEMYYPRIPMWSAITCC